MSIITEFFSDIFFQRFLVRFLGVRTRFLFYKIIGKDRLISDLHGRNKDFESQISQDFFNAVIGFFALFAIITLIAFLLYG